jgi:transaldolase / glucose-6-phosphate isomerase
MNQLSYTLPSELAAAVQQTLDEWQQNDRMSRLWNRDASLWSGGDEAQWLGWLDIVQASLAQVDELRDFGKQIAESSITHVVLLGMGGSSMAPEVLRECFGSRPGYPALEVLDSTDPAQVRTVEVAVDLQHTLFVVASKSGSTLEPNILMAYFYQRMIETVGAGQVASHFMAITDPGSHLEREATEKQFRRIFSGRPDVGGRFSALSSFGMVPVALLGVDCRRFLDRTLEMVEACGPGGKTSDNPGAVLGCILGVAANHGRDKLTLVATPQLASIGAWLEQLVAESTGKQGKAVIPLDGEALMAPGGYGEDRVFVYLCGDAPADPEQAQAVMQLELADHPVIRITLAEIHDLGQELFRWEIATAVTGAILGVNPFDQPDVEASKIETRKLTAAYESGSGFPEETRVANDGVLSIYSDERNAAELVAACGPEAGVSDILKAHLGRIRPGDYVALLAYIERNAAHTDALQAIRADILREYRVATCLGFGPRFLHSTGQAYKGGPNSGVFLQLTCDAENDLPVPGHKYTFGVVEAAQARGDFAVLAERQRRALRVHLGSDVAAGLERLGKVMADVLSRDR